MDAEENKGRRKMVSVEILLGGQNPEVWATEMNRSTGGKILLNHMKNRCVCGTAACAQKFFLQTFRGIENPELIIDLFEELKFHEQASFTKVAHVIDAYVDKVNATLRLEHLRKTFDHEGNEILPPTKSSLN